MPYEPDLSLKAIIESAAAAAEERIQLWEQQSETVPEHLRSCEEISRYTVSMAVEARMPRADEADEAWIASVLVEEPSILSGSSRTGTGSSLKYVLRLAIEQHVQQAIAPTVIGRVTEITDTRNSSTSVSPR